MKWKEWVAAVEQKMKEKDIEEDPEIFYIDTHMPDNPDAVDVSISEHGMDITNF